MQVKKKLNLYIIFKYFANLCFIFKKNINFMSIICKLFVYNFPTLFSNILYTLFHIQKIHRNLQTW